MESYQESIRILGLISGVMMPLWNIPLILRIIKRKSAEDISMLWLFGVWACILGMLPSTLLSSDMVLKSFGISNSILFSVVVLVVVLYRKK